jgi:hypothetical protein
MFSKGIFFNGRESTGISGQRLWVSAALGGFQNPKPQNDEIPKELNLLKIDHPTSGGPGESNINRDSERL